LQMWAALRTPAYKAGPLQIRGEFGAQQAFYDADKHTVAISQLTLESLPQARNYFSVTYVARTESGTTPFLFDRVLIPQELYSQCEIPLGRGPWSVGLSNRLDLEQKETRDIGISAIYRQDCLSYGLTYSAVGKTIGLGIIVNAFGTFRKSPGHVTFTE